MGFGKGYLCTMIAMSECGTLCMLAYWYILGGVIGSCMGIDMPFERFSWTTAIRWCNNFLRLNGSKYYLIYMRKAIHVLGILDCGTSLHRKITMSSTMIVMRIFTTWCGWYDFMRDAFLIHFWLVWHDNGEPNTSVDTLGERCKYDTTPITPNNLELCCFDKWRIWFSTCWCSAACESPMLL